MTLPLRLCLALSLCSAPATLLRAADEPDIVIQRAPDTSDDSAAREEARRLAAEIADLRTRLQSAQATIEVLTAKNQQLDATLAARTDELRDVKALLASAETRVKELTAARSANASSADALAAEKARADEATTRLNTVVAGATRLQEEKARLESQLAQTRQAEADLREQLAAAPKPDDTLAAKLAETESQLAEARRAHTVLQAENDVLRAAADDHKENAAALQTLRSEKAALESQLTELRATEASLREQLAAATNRPEPTQPSREIAARLADLENKLSTSLRSYTLLQQENDRLQASAAEREKLAAELESLRAEKSELESKVADQPPADLASRLAETEDKLNTTLRSFSQLQAENDRLKTEAARATESAHTSAERSAADNAAQMAALYEELRQTKAQLASLSADNAQLKTRLALSGPPPGSGLSTPTRPGAVRHENTDTPAPPPAAAPRQHTVVLGDTLAKISRHYYGTPGRWDEILAANRDVIQNENALTVGTTLRIP
jgi:Chromosome segregation ATPases